MKKQICDVLYKALLILLVIQIILGIHWIIGSLGTHIGLTVPVSYTHLRAHET